MIGACSTYLQRQLDMINCVDVITLAENYALPRLRRFAYNFISENFNQLTRQQINRLSIEQVIKMKPHLFIDIEALTYVELKRMKLQ